MKKILISACLVGDKTKYDGKSNYTPKVKELLERYELIPFCPEVEGGLPTPRTPSERKDGKVITKGGKDVTRQYMSGAEKALNICKYLGIEVVILKENSPSCGVNNIYDGSHTGKLIPGMGVTTELLREHGIRVINENQIDELL